MQRLLDLGAAAAGGGGTPIEIERGRRRRHLFFDEPSAGLSPAYQDEVFVRCRQINRTGVSIIMVEQNARRCLQICHRGYVLDQGTNAYTGAGDELLHDPKVIELYLGTLARA